MIIGNGMLARAFAEFKDSEEVVVFASGTANSLETDQSVFDRETKLLSQVRNEYRDSLLVYFSTCSIVDPDRWNTPYVQHKIKIAEHLKHAGLPYLVLRLPVVVGESNLARTLPFYIRDQIVRGCRLAVWQNAVRFPIDIEDAVMISSALIGDKTMHNRCVDVALRAYAVPQIVREMELVLGKTANSDKIDRGTEYSIDMRTAHQLADALHISYDHAYLGRLLRKYFSLNRGLTKSNAWVEVGDGHQRRSGSNDGG